MDTVMAHQAGVINTVAVSGTALTPDQLTLISRLTNTIVFSFDMDAAGQSATKRSLELAADFDLQRKVLLLPSGKDPADAVCENPEIFLTALQNARPITDYYFEEAGKRYPIKDPQGKKEAGAFFLPHIRALKNEIERAHWIQQFAHLISVPESSVRQELEKLLRPQSKTVSGTSHVLQKKPRRELLEERLLALYLENSDIFQKVEKNIEEPLVFTMLAHERLFHELKKNTHPISSEFITLYDALEFQRELLDFKNLKLEEEIRSCIHTLLAEHYKERRDLTQQQIKHLEKQGNQDKIRELLSEFHSLSAKVTHYSS
jgi:DNA primase